MKTLFTSLILSLGIMSAAAQVSVSSSGTSPDPSAMLDVMSSDKGLLPPRMTSAERDAIASPASGLLIYNTDTECINLRIGGTWTEICGSCIPAPTPSDAGPDQLDLSGVTAAMAANAPVNGSGAWSVQSGSGGSFSDTSDPGATFTGAAGVTYVLRWTITNACGSDSDDLTVSFINPFTCGTSSVSYGGKDYSTVLINGQCWLRENLDIGSQINNSQNCSSCDQTNNGTIEKFCYNNSAANCTSGGGIYQWNEAMQYTTTPGARGICPEGWHIPTRAEWQSLVNFYGGNGTAGTSLKQCGGGQFCALMVGFSYDQMVQFPWGQLGTETRIWTSDGAGSSSNYYRELQSGSSGISESTRGAREGMSVRCLKD
jgi:uncharacterized protein (TIGR02145 family)